MKIERPAPLADQVFGALQADIFENRLAAGAKLPIEPELAARFGVSRTVIREAMARLRTDGLITSRQGAGVFVTEAPVDRTFRLAGQEPATAQDIGEIFELRLGIEAEAAALAARRRTPEDLHLMHQAVQAMAQTADGPDLGVAADAAFHRAVALACGNAKIAAFQGYLAVFLVQGIAAARENTRRAHPGAAEEVLQEHAAILAAVQAQQSDPARAAMRAHLVNAQRRLGLLPTDRRP